MTPEIERCARTIARRRDELRLGPDGVTWPADEEYAKAALEALLEPSEAMIAAAWSVIDGEKQKAGITRLGPGLGVSEIYTAMIRKALGQ